VGTKRPRYFLNYFINNRGLLFYQLERYCKHLMRKESPYVLEDLDPEEAARRARAREAYEKMYPLSDDPYGAKRMERVQTVAGVTRVFNQVARESGLGGLVDDPDSEQTRRLEPREIDRNAYRQPIARQRCPRESRSRRRPGWVVTHFVLPRSIVAGLSVLARGMAERERAERRNAPRGRRRRYPRTRNFFVTDALNALLAEYDLSQFCVVEEDEESSPRRVRRFSVSG
jgi:hypothetical protein